MSHDKLNNLPCLSSSIHSPSIHHAHLSHCHQHLVPSTKRFHFPFRSKWSFSSSEVRLDISFIWSSACPSSLAFPSCFSSSAVSKSSSYSERKENLHYENENRILILAHFTLMRTLTPLPLLSGPSFTSFHTISEHGKLIANDQR